MSVETLRKSRKQVFTYSSICFFIWSITRTDMFQTYFTSQFQTQSNSHIKSFLISQLPSLIGLVIFVSGAYALWKYIKAKRTSDQSVQNALKDELTTFEWSYAFGLSWFITLILLLILTCFSGFGISGKDVSLLLFGTVTGLPHLVFAIRDNLSE